MGKGGKEEGGKKDRIHVPIHSFFHYMVSCQVATMYQVLYLLSTEDKRLFKTISTLLQLSIFVELFLN